MGFKETAVDTVGPSRDYWYRLGAIAALAIGTGYIIIFPSYAHVG